MKSTQPNEPQAAVGGDAMLHVNDFDNYMLRAEFGGQRHSVEQHEEPQAGAGAEVVVAGNNSDDYMRYQAELVRQQQTAVRDDMIARLQAGFNERVGVLKAEHREELQKRDEKLDRWKRQHQKTLGELRAKNVELEKSLKDRSAKIVKLGKLAKLAKKVLKDFVVVEGMEEGSAIDIDD